MGARLFYILLLLLSANTVLCQQDKDVEHVHILRKKLAASTTDTVRIRLFHQLAALSKPDSALRYEHQAMELSRAIRHMPGIIDSYTNIGAIHRNQSDYYKAISLYKKAIASAGKEHEALLVRTFLELGIAYLRTSNLDSAEQSLLRGLALNETSKDASMEASLYNMLGNVRKDENDYSQAIEYYLKAVVLFKELNDKSGLTQAVSNVGNLEYVLGNYEKALSYALESLALAEEINQLSSVAYSNRLLGRIYRKQQKFDEALASYAKAVELYRSLGARRDVSETLYNAGNIYFERSDFKKAIAHYQDALAIQRSVPDTLNMAYSYSAIGQAYFELQRYNNTLRYLDSAAALATRRNLAYIMLDIYDFKSKVYAERKQFDEAYLQHVLFSDLKDSLTLHENRIAAQEIENRFQQAQQEEQIRNLNADRKIAALQIQEKNTQRNYLLGLTALAIVLVGLLYNRYKIKTKATRKLEELDRLKSRFFTNLSHEFRTPLSLISGPLLKMIEREREPTAKEELELMARNAQRLTSLINQLLDLSRLESGNMKLHVAEGDIGQALRIWTSSFTSFAAYKSISFTTDIQDSVAHGFFDHNKIEQVVSNLLSNALKFTPSQGTVHLYAAVSEGRLFVEVKDNGIGIPPAAVPYVFNRFYQVDDSATRLHEGSGIGLALCKELVELHKGTIKAESDEDRGSVFSFSIPVTRSAYRRDEIVSIGEALPRPAVIHNPAIDTGSAVSADESWPLILVAEDNEDMRGFISRVLAPHYRVVGVADGHEALSRAQESVPDLIITDVMMPNMDGRTLCHKIKSEIATSHIPVVMLTARADQESKLDGLRTGADDYLTKPFDANELMVRVDNLIRQRKRLQEVFRERIVLRPQDLDVADPSDKFLAQALNIVEQNYADHMFGVDQFAAELAMSRTQLHRKLKALTNTPPGDLLRQFRLERAKQLLLVDGSQVSEVAYRTGFNNLSNFTKAFRDFTGVTPSDFSASSTINPSK